MSQVKRHIVPQFATRQVNANTFRTQTSDTLGTGGKEVAAGFTTGEALTPLEPDVQIYNIQNRCLYLNYELYENFQLF